MILVLIFCFVFGMFGFYSVEAHDYYQEFYPDRWDYYFDDNAEVSSPAGGGKIAFETFLIHGSSLTINELQEMRNKLFLSYGINENLEFRGNIGYAPWAEYHGYADVKYELPEGENIRTALVAGAYLSSGEHHDNNPEARLMVDYMLADHITLYNEFKVKNDPIMELKNGVHYIIDSGSAVKAESYFNSHNDFNIEVGYRYNIEPMLDYIGYVQTNNLFDEHAGLLNYIDNGVVYNSPAMPEMEFGCWFRLDFGGEATLNASAERDFGSFTLKGRGSFGSGNSGVLSLVLASDF